MVENGSDFTHSLIHQAQPPKSIGDKDVIPTFLAYMEGQDISRGSFRTYRSVVGRFADHFPELPLYPGPIQEYIDGLPLSSESKHSHFVILRRLYRFLEETYQLVNPFPQVKEPHRDRGKKSAPRPEPRPTPPRTPQETPRLSTAQYLRSFLDSCRARGLRVRTVENYEQRLSVFVQRCPDLPTTPDPIEAFFAGLIVNQETRFGYFQVLKVFYRFLEARHNVFHPAAIPNPITALKILHPHSKPLKGLEAPQLGDLLKACSTNLDRTLIMLLVDTGIRISEAVSVEKKDIGQDTLTVRGKSGEREVPISSTMRDLLLAFAKGDGRIFTDREGESARHQLSFRVRQAMKKAGITGIKMGPHTLRHTFGRQYIRAGGDPFALQKTFGHSTLGMTRRYAELETVDLVEKHKKFSPFHLIEDQVQPALPLDPPAAAPKDGKRPARKGRELDQASLLDLLRKPEGESHGLPAL